MLTFANVCWFDWKIFLAYDILIKIEKYVASFHIICKFYMRNCVYCTRIWDTNIARSNTTIFANLDSRVGTILLLLLKASLLPID